MKDTIDLSIPSADFRAQLEEIATDLVVGGAAPEASARFRQLAAIAEAQGWSETSQMAIDLSRGTGQEPDGRTPDNPALENRLAEDLASLTRAFDRDTGAASQAPASFSLAQDPELIGDFVMESREHLGSIEGNMLILERNPEEMETVHAVFRSFHTIKGLAGFLEFTPIRDVSHEVETLLDLARSSAVTITPAAVDLVLASADYLKEAVGLVEASLPEGGAIPFSPNEALLARIRGFLAGEPCNPPAPGGQPSTDLITPPSQKPGANKAPDSFSVRVDTAKLDKLMDMVGEMVIAQSLIRHNRAVVSLRDQRLIADIAHLARITGEVQRTAMDMRMIPIGQLFQRTSRLVRDLSRKSGKQVRLETSGDDIELDKTIADELADPLMHMVRNAIDHGIELPEERNASGKNPSATIRLAAYHLSGQVVIEIADDGRGLNRDKILRKAERQGLVASGAQLSRGEVFHLIFEPGFSTADQVTDISGRGVGMDVVRQHVHKLRGRIEIESQEGQGTVFTVRVPLTLAIIDGLVVKAGPEQYIVPIFTVKEILRPTADTLSTIQERDEMALVRGRLLPVVRLCRQFGIPPKSEDPTDCLLLVTESRDRTFCLMVDELVGKQEVVIKSLGNFLKDIPGIAGGSILGDGRVGLILDVDGIFPTVRQ